MNHVRIFSILLQKNHRELEVIVQEALLNTIRESIPVESILKAYMDQTVENEVVEEIKEQYIEESVQKKEGEAPKSVQVATSDPDIIEEKKVSFNNVDYVKDTTDTVREVDNSKTVSRVVDEDDENFKLQIFDAPDSSLENINLEIETIEEPKLPELLKDDLDFEVLEE